MVVRFSADVEREEQELRAQQREKVSWEIYRTKSIVDAVHTAKKQGWKDKLIQVRLERLGEDTVEYVLEPYESGCGCAGLLRYEDYFEEGD